MLTIEKPPKLHLTIIGLTFPNEHLSGLKKIMADAEVAYFAYAASDVLPHGLVTLSFLSTL